MNKIIEQKIPYGNKNINILTNESDSKKIIIFFHGLDGSAASARPLFNEFSDYKIVAVEQRGHMKSEIKSSRFIFKHLRDYLFIIKYFYEKKYKIWIIGESMGAAYATLIAYLPNNMVTGVFAQSIPNKVVDVLKIEKKDAFKIKFMTFISYITNINYSYVATIDYVLFSNSKTLHRVARMADKNKKRQVRETIATWTANRTAWKKMKNKIPYTPVYYFQPTDDITTNIPKVERIFNLKRDNLTLIKVEGAKHILMHEKQFSEVLAFIRKTMEI